MGHITNLSSSSNMLFLLEKHTGALTGNSARVSLKNNTVRYTVSKIIVPMGILDHLEYVLSTPGLSYKGLIEEVLRIKLCKVRPCVR